MSSLKEEIGKLHQVEGLGWCEVLANAEKALELAEASSDEELCYYAASAVVWLAGSFKEFQRATEVLQKYPALREDKEWLKKIARNAIRCLYVHRSGITLDVSDDGLIYEHELLACGAFIESFVDPDAELRTDFEEASKHMLGNIGKVGFYAGYGLPAI